ncbi:cytochrome oxidase putative small subunit CydP [Trinickia sp.]|uniref:cytochrome oxidase putative small subunit CydP n=1 Tax=Trinickia sp. TaxID=2571163 RepID=UPI003F7FB672
MDQRDQREFETMRLVRPTNAAHDQGDGEAAARRPRPSSIRHWVRGPTFARDIALVLTLKVALLIGLKLAFFNHPRAPDMSLPPADVARVLLSSPATRAPQGVGHAQ